MEWMKEHSPVMCLRKVQTNIKDEFKDELCSQALIVSRELIRVAILWHELWHEGLEEASRLYFTEKNPDGMIAALEPLYEMLEQVLLSAYHNNPLAHNDLDVGTNHSL